jgi:hypothetical protein
MISKIGYFWQDGIANMYKLHPPTVCLDDSYINKFIQKEVEGEEIQMNWWHDPNSFKVI